MILNDILLHSEVGVLSSGSQKGSPQQQLRWEQMQRATARHYVESLNYTLGRVPEILWKGEEEL